MKGRMNSEPRSCHDCGDADRASGRSESGCRQGCRAATNLPDAVVRMTARSPMEQPDTCRCARPVGQRALYGEDHGVEAPRTHRQHQLLGRPEAYGTTWERSAGRRAGAYSARSALLEPIRGECPSGGGATRIEVPCRQFPRARRSTTLRTWRIYRGSSIMCSGRTPSVSARDWNAQSWE